VNTSASSCAAHLLADGCEGVTSGGVLHLLGSADAEAVLCTSGSTPSTAPGQAHWAPAVRGARHRRHRRHRMMTGFRTAQHGQAAADTCAPHNALSLMMSQQVMLVALCAPCHRLQCWQRSSTPWAHWIQRQQQPMPQPPGSCSAPLPVRNTGQRQKQLQWRCNTQRILEKAADKNTSAEQHMMLSCNVPAVSSIWTALSRLGGPNHRSNTRAK
jgi:hypothetical protein